MRLRNFENKRLGALWNRRICLWTGRNLHYGKHRLPKFGTRQILYLGQENMDDPHMHISPRILKTVIV